MPKNKLESNSKTSDGLLPYMIEQHYWFGDMEKDDTLYRALH
jgi:hypothetical protein